MNQRARALAQIWPWTGSVPRGALRQWAVRLAGCVPVAVALGLWVSGTPSIDVRRMNDLGLISVLSPAVLAAIALLLISAVAQLHRQPLDGPVLAVHLVALVVALYGIAPWVEDAPRTSTVWTHLGFVESIARTGDTTPTLDARMSWPGFFVASAFAGSLVGLDSITFIAHWSSVLFNLLYVIPIAIIVRSLTGDTRLMWASTLLFTVTNWIGQDYFAPQALAFFMYLVVMTLVVSRFLVRRPGSRAVLARLRSVRLGGTLFARVYELLTPEHPVGRTLSGRQQVAVVAMLIAIFAYIMSSHQLMPFVTVGSLTALLVLNRVALRSIPILLGVMAVTWVSYMTVPFLSGHLAGLITEVGSVGETFTANVTGRIGGSPEHRFVVTVRLLFTLALWGLAGLGALLRFREGKRDLTVAVLAAAPFALIVLQAYGGEMLLRLYLFSLPFVAVFAAGLVYGRRQGRPSGRASVATAMGVIVIAAGFLVARYGNERIDLMPASEVQAVEVLYDTAPPGSLLVASTYNLPWKFEKYELYEYASADDLDVDAIAEEMRNPKYQHSYLILTKSQGAYAELFVGLAPGSWDRFVDQVNESPLFQLLYRNADAEIFTLRESTAATPP